MQRAKNDHLLGEALVYAVLLGQAQLLVLEALDAVVEAGGRRIKEVLGA